ASIGEAFADFLPLLLAQGRLDTVLVCGAQLDRRDAYGLANLEDRWHVPRLGNVVSDDAQAKLGRLIGGSGNASGGRESPECQADGPCLEETTTMRHKHGATPRRNERRQMSLSSAVAGGKQGACGTTCPRPIAWLSPEQ